MRKLFCLLLIVCLLIPSAVFADDLSGCWYIWMPSTVSMGTGNLSLVLILNEDGTGAVLNCTSNTSAHSASVVSSSIKWTFANSILCAETEDGGKQLFMYSDDKIWYSFPESTIKFGLVKAPDFDLSQLAYK